MSTRKATSGISVLRNRVYSDHFIWTAEINEDLYHMYLSAKRDGPGYMKRLKLKWDTKHPHLKHFSENHLRQQASQYEKRTRMSVIEHGNAENNIRKVGNSDEEGRSLNDNKSRNDQRLQDELKIAFISQFERFRTQNLEGRAFETRVNFRTPVDTVAAMNEVMKSLIESKAIALDTIWDVNVAIYAASITIIEKHSRLKQRSGLVKPRKAPTWESSLQSQINSVRRQISFIMCVLECQSTGKYTPKQRRVEAKVKRLVGSLRKMKIESKLALLKHRLKTLNLQLKDKRIKATRNSINRVFQANQKAVYRSFSGLQTEVLTPPNEKELNDFWGNVWRNPKQIDLDQPWYEKLTEKYCHNVCQKEYTLTMNDLKSALNRMPNHKAPGTDLITAYWLKQLTSLHPTLLVLLQQIYSGELQIPNWLATSRTVLIAKNRDTHLANNFRPIACQNSTYKVYTSILNSYLDDHCTTNSIITTEQAGGKKGSWGCVDQLLINKMILDEVRKYRRSLFCIWYDYRKAFDTVSHDWLRESLKLAKVPKSLYEALISLTRVWATKAYLNTANSTLNTDTIAYQNGIMQGDCLAMLLFTISINPLSFILSETCKGYTVGEPGQRKYKVTHLLYVDDLKTYATSRKDAMKQAELITQFTSNIGMAFSHDKCAYLNIEKGLRKSLGVNLNINDLQISELKSDNPYKYLGVDEDVRYRSEITKQAVRAEYLSRVRKIWRSELYANNKVHAHNTYALPVLVHTFAVVDWTKEDIQELDVLTRKQLTMNGSFHLNGDIDRLYTARKEGGRGLKSVLDVYLARLVSLASHLEKAANTNFLLEMVKQHEKERLMRASHLFQNALQINHDQVWNTNEQQITALLQSNHKQAWLVKPMHGYTMLQQMSSKNYCKTNSNIWLQSSSMTSHTEGYFNALQEQEIATRHLQRRRAKNPGAIDSRCRHCGIHEEDIYHIIGSCSKLCNSMYLPFRHDVVAKYIYTEILLAQDPQTKLTKPEPVRNLGDIEIWWDVKVPCAPAVPCNRPDMVVWNKDKRTCHIVEVGIPLDKNVDEVETTKQSKYVPLAVNLKRAYPEYTFECVPIVVGALGLVTKNLPEHLMILGFDKRKAHRMIKKIAEKVVLGTVRIAKSALALKRS